MIFDCIYEIGEYFEVIIMTLLIVYLWLTLSLQIVLKAILKLIADNKRIVRWNKSCAVSNWNEQFFHFSGVGQKLFEKSYFRQVE